MLKQAFLGSIYSLVSILSFKWCNYHRFFGRQFHYSYIYLKWYLGTDNRCSFRLRIGLNLLIKRKGTLGGARFYLLLVVYSAESHLIFPIQSIYKIKARAWYTSKNMIGCLSSEMHNWNEWFKVPKKKAHISISNYEQSLLQSIFIFHWVYI